MQTKNIDQTYKYREFPKMVYRHGAPNLESPGATMIINSEDERPEGYVDHEDWVRGSVSEAAADAGAGAVLAAEAASSKKAADDAEAARQAAAEAAEAEKKAVEEERARIKEKLESHNVEFAPQLGLPKLQELEAKLDEFLANPPESEPAKPEESTFE